jgi:UDP-2,4-diacetamido-2,4,6-trideoxy-beta-L-altropyranose hydrolase
MVVKEKFEVRLLTSALNESDDSDLSHADWLGTSRHADAMETMHLLSDGLWDWVIVDHYALDEKWETMVRAAASRIMVIDDIADRVHNCDLLLDQNFYVGMEKRYEGKVPLNCQLLLGPRYGLLREQFREIRESVKQRNGPVKRILIFFGGVDGENYSARAINAVAGIGGDDLHVDVVLGAEHPHIAQIRALCAAHAYNCHVQTHLMADLMALADLAIGAGGSATWERCCLGLPALTICVASNQQELIRDAASAGLIYSPDVGGDLTLHIRRHVVALIENSYLRRAISGNCMSAVDGSGASRVAGHLDCSDIDIRAARQDDSRNLYEWRNHPSVRAGSRNSELITWESHERWFASVTNAPDRLLLLGHQSGVPLGVVRFDIQGTEAEVSIYRVPGCLLPGRGKNLLKRAEHWISAHRPDVLTIRAHILEANERSRNLFSEAGYKLEFSSYLKKVF